MLSLLKRYFAFLLTLLLLTARTAFAQDSFERALAKKLDSMGKEQNTKTAENILSPDDASTTLTIPSGFGGYGAAVFGGVGGIYPQVYTRKPDLIASAGFCVGDPTKAVNFSISGNIQNVSELNNYSLNFTVSRNLGRGTSISAGGLQLFTSRLHTDAPGYTIFFAVSHAVQQLASETDGASKLTYTIGVGTGRFYRKSADDIKAGRGKHGTGLFGGVAYEIIHHVNMSAEWSGVNLGAGLSARPFTYPVALGLAVVNLTRYSAEKPGFIATLGLPLSLTNR